MLVIQKRLNGDEHRLLSQRPLKALLLEERLVGRHRARQTPGRHNVAIVYDRAWLVFTSRIVQDSEGAAADAGNGSGGRSAGLRS